jgi:hypothetical protein
MKTATIIGSAMASFTVQKFGTKSLEELILPELKERLDIFKSLTEFELT